MEMKRFRIRNKGKCQRIRIRGRLAGKSRGKNDLVKSLMEEFIKKKILLKIKFYLIIN